jgi:hypothetical protein
MLPQLLVLTMLVIIYQGLGFSQGHLKSGERLRRKGVLAGTGWVPPFEWWVQGQNWWTWSGLRIHRTQGSQGSHSPRLLGQILQLCSSLSLPHLMLKARVWNWVLVPEVDEVAHRAVFSQSPQAIQAP